MLLLILKKQTKQPSKAHCKAKGSGVLPKHLLKTNLDSLQTAFLTRFYLLTKYQAWGAGQTLSVVILQE